jgi:hypothetical protein
MAGLDKEICLSNVTPLHLATARKDQVAAWIVPGTSLDDQTSLNLAEALLVNLLVQ